MRIITNKSRCLGPDIEPEAIPPFTFLPSVIHKCHTVDINIGTHDSL